MAYVLPVEVDFAVIDVDPDVVAVGRVTDDDTALVDDLRARLCVATCSNAVVAQRNSIFQRRRGRSSGGRARWVWAADVVDAGTALRKSVW